MFNLLFTIVLPVVILTWFSGEDRLGPDWGLAIALAFPIAFAGYELVRDRKIGMAPIVGVIGVLLTGGFRLFEIPPKWFAIKEAAVPAALALAILVSAWIGRPLARVFLDQMLDREGVHAALAERGTAEEYERRTSKATYLLASAFVLSGILNFALARIVVTSEPGTDAFNSELGRMTALSYPVITVPVMIVLVGTIFYVLSTVTKLTGLEAEQAMRQKGSAGRKRDDRRSAAAAAAVPPDGTFGERREG